MRGMQPMGRGKMVATPQFNLQLTSISVRAHQIFPRPAARSIARGAACLFSFLALANSRLPARYFHKSGSVRPTQEPRDSDADDPCAASLRVPEFLSTLSGPAPFRSADPVRQPR